MEIFPHLWREYPEKNRQIIWMGWECSSPVGFFKIVAQTKTAWLSRLHKNDKPELIFSVNAKYATVSFTSSPRGLLWSCQASRDSPILWTNISAKHETGLGDIKLSKIDSLLSLFTL